MASQNSLDYLPYINIPYTVKIYSNYTHQMGNRHAKRKFGVLKPALQNI
jgi:hypothetical protein